MNRLRMLAIALALLVIALPLISIGTTGNNASLWWLGLAALIVGGLIPPIMRFAPEEDKDAEKAETRESRKESGE